MWKPLPIGLRLRDMLVGSFFSILTTLAVRQPPASIACMYRQGTFQRKTDVKLAMRVASMDTPPAPYFPDSPHLL